jgi:hypothetical protein
MIKIYMMFIGLLMSSELISSKPNYLTVAFPLPCKWELRMGDSNLNVSRANAMKIKSPKQVSQNDNSILTYLFQTKTTQHWFFFPNTRGMFLRRRTIAYT